RARRAEFAEKGSQILDGPGTEDDSRATLLSCDPWHGFRMLRQLPRPLRDRPRLRVGPRSGWTTAGHKASARSGLRRDVSNSFASPDTFRRALNTECPMPRRHVAKGNEVEVALTEGPRDHLDPVAVGLRLLRVEGPRRHDVPREGRRANHGVAAREGRDGVVQ